MKYLVIAFFAVSAKLFAIVDIAPAEIGGAPGVSGNVAGSYVSKTGNTEKDEYDLNGKLQYDSNQSYLTFLQASYQRTDTFDYKTEEEKFAHLRYIHKLNDETLCLELFAQYKRNIFQGIDNRWLAGAGIRWRFLNDAELGRLYVGLGAFREDLDYNQHVTDEDVSTTRLNSYLAYTNALGESARLNLIGYYQPSFEDSGDYYGSFMAELTVHVIYELYLSFAYDIDYDSRPPSGVKKRDRMTKTSLIWKF
jgi:putative salt-induced outer membrane protein YdiY